MATFTPPTDLTSQPTDNSDDQFNYASLEKRLANRLARFRRPTPKGRNVFYLTNGTYTESEPGDSALVSKVYHGGHIHVITSEEQASLTAAGYGAYIA
jgi:hypothetical protein